MCGIAGIVGSRRLAPGDADAARRMSAVLEHRGPDEHGFHLDDQAAIAHRRLSIVDLKSGHQPLTNEDRSLWITFNGEIYNHVDIRRELEAHGHRYRTKSDTETIVHAYEQWGVRAIERFRGMFAFGIWDTRRSRLVLVRDRLGIKPLYWCMVGDRLLFASEIKALLASDLITAEANEDALPELLTTRYLSGERTLFRGIHKLLPGHWLSFEGGRVSIHRYWDVPGAEGSEAGESATRPAIGASPREAGALVHRFRELLEESVRLRLMSDVPLGVFLSGGIDSSVIAAIMSRQIDRPIETFSVAFEQRAFSELEYSRQVAEAIGARRHETVVSDRDFFGSLPRLVWHEDEPIAHPSSVPLYFVSKLAREHVTVVLTGEGSDELLAGYGKYPRAVLNWQLGGYYAQLMPDALRRPIADTLVPRLPSRLRRYAERSFLAVDHTPAATFFDNFAAIRLADLRLLATGALLQGATPQRAYGASVSYFEAGDGDRTLLDRMLYTDVKTYLVELLMKQDQMSMATSIESRVPFLDHVLVEFASQLPPRLKLSGFTTKRVLREAARDLLPASILSRPKMGFPVPFAQWSRGAWAGWVRELLLDRASRERGLFDPAAVERLLDDHARGTRSAGDIVWTLVNLELWYRTFIDGSGVQTLGEPRRTTPGAGADAAPGGEPAMQLPRTA